MKKKTRKAKKEGTYFKPAMTSTAVPNAPIFQAVFATRSRQESIAFLSSWLGGETSKCVTQELIYTKHSQQYNSLKKSWVISIWTLFLQQTWFLSFIYILFKIWVSIHLENINKSKELSLLELLS